MMKAEVWEFPTSQPSIEDKLLEIFLAASIPKENAIKYSQKFSSEGVEEDLLSEMPLSGLRELGMNLVDAMKMSRFSQKKNSSQNNSLLSSSTPNIHALLSSSSQSLGNGASLGVGSNMHHLLSTSMQTLPQPQHVHSESEHSNNTNLLKNLTLNDPATHDIIRILSPPPNSNSPINIGNLTPNGNLSPINNSMNNGNLTPSGNLSPINGNQSPIHNNNNNGTMMMSPSPLNNSNGNNNNSNLNNSDPPSLSSSIGIPFYSSSILSESQVALLRWLESKELDESCAEKLISHKIDINNISLLNERDLERIGINDIGCMKTLLNEIEQMKAKVSIDPSMLVRGVKIEKELGAGIGGVVFKGHMERAPVALKKLHKQSQLSSKEFFTELSIIQKLHHPNIVTFFGVWVDEREEYYIVMELMSKGDLLNRLRSDSHFVPFNNRFLAILDVLRGLAYLELRQVVHRDIAARNVLVDDKYTCKISDFGLGG